MSTINYIKIPDCPFEFATITLCPHDVNSTFMLESWFQRDVRLNSRMIQNIQQTLHAQRTIPATLVLAEIKRKLVVVDGKHRLYALANLGAQIRVTLFAHVYRHIRDGQLAELFALHNQTIPPSMNVLIRNFAAENPDKIKLLGDHLPCPMEIGTRKPECGLTYSEAVRLLSKAFADMPKPDRFTVTSGGGALRRGHAIALGRFIKCFEIATQKAVGRENSRWSQRWHIPLFRLYVQNQDKGLSDAEWSERFRRFFAETYWKQLWDVGPVVMSGNVGVRNRFLYDLGSRKRNLLRYKSGQAPVDPAMFEEGHEKSVSRDRIAS